MTSGTITREQFEVRQIKDKRALSAQKKQVLICAGTGCIAGGSLDIYDYLKEACAKRGIQVQVGLLHEDGEVEAPAKGGPCSRSSPTASSTPTCRCPTATRSSTRPF